MRAVKTPITGFVPISVAPACAPGREAGGASVGAASARPPAGYLYSRHPLAPEVEREPALGSGAGSSALLLGSAGGTSALLLGFRSGS